MKLPTLKNGLSYTAYAWANDPLRLKNFWMNRLAKNEPKNRLNEDVIVGYYLEDFFFKNKELKQLKFKNKDNNLIVEADYFILCMGGIENARFTKKLLRKNNIPNKDLIGNFQEHPHLFNIAGFNKGKNKLPTILRRRKKISNSSHKSFKNGEIKFAISAWDGPGTPKISLMVHENLNNPNPLKHLIKEVIRRERIPKFDFSVSLRCEQTPNISSYLNFKKESTTLNWNIKDSDFEHYSKYLRRFSSFLILNNYAKDFQLNESAINGIAFPNSVAGGAHHCGTIPYLKNEILINFITFVNPF